jgi:hypothetical protein
MRSAFLPDTLHVYNKRIVTGSQQDSGRQPNISDCVAAMVGFNRTPRRYGAALEHAGFGE